MLQGSTEPHLHCRGARLAQFSAADLPEAMWKTTIAPSSLVFVLVVVIDGDDTRNFDWLRA